MEVTITILMVISCCTKELLICPLKHDSAEELTSEWLGMCIMFYGLKAGIKKLESPISTAALAFLSLLPLNTSPCGQERAQRMGPGACAGSEMVSGGAWPVPCWM